MRTICAAARLRGVAQLNIVDSILHAQASTALPSVDAPDSRGRRGQLHAAGPHQRTQPERKQCHPARGRPLRRRQQGCMRYSFLPLQSRVPRRYRCQPDQDSPTPVASWFVSTDPFDPRFGQLHEQVRNLKLVAGTVARMVSPGIELVALFVEEDVPGGSFTPGTSTRAVTVAVAEIRDGGWQVAGLNCLAVPGWPPTWPPVDASLRRNDGDAVALADPLPVRRTKILRGGMTRFPTPPGHTRKASPRSGQGRFR